MYLVENLQRVNYTNRQGKIVNGIRLLLSIEDNSGTWENGRQNDIIYCNANNVDDVSIGDYVEVFYNKYGNVSKVTLVNE